MLRPENPVLPPSTLTFKSHKLPQAANTIATFRYRLLPFHSFEKSQMAKPFPDAFFPINGPGNPNRLLSHICSHEDQERHSNCTPNNKEEGSSPNTHTAGDGRRTCEVCCTTAASYCIKVLIFQETTTSTENHYTCQLCWGQLLHVCNV